MITRHDVAMGLRMAYWAMHRHTDACLDKRGVTANQFVLLALLAEADGITQQELVCRASSDPNTVRAMLVLLEKQGFVAREKHPTDGRANSVTLTPKGRQMHKKVWTDTESVRQRLLTVLKPGEADTLVEMLARIAEVMAPWTPDKTKRSQKEEM
jgi:DNA-binding MarR family transcriptional regulator